VENPLEDDSHFVRVAMKQLGFECEFHELDAAVMSSVLRLASIIKLKQSREGGNPPISSNGS
jgi:hypothetical protein